MESVSTRAVLLDLAGAATEPEGPLLNCSVGLFSNDILPTSDMALSDFTPAAFSGSALLDGIVLEFGSPWIDEQGQAHRTAPSIQITCTADDQQETIYGWYVMNEARNTVLFAARLDEPILVDHVDDAVIFQPDWILGK